MVYSPIVHCHPIAVNHTLPRGFDYWRQYNQRMIRACDIFVTLQIEGLDLSVGVAGEREYAEQLNKKIGRLIPEGTGQFWLQVL